MIWGQIVKNFKLRAPERKPAKAMPTHKTCKECQQLLPLSQYYRRGEGDRLVSRCKKCYVARSIAQQRASRDKRKLPVSTFTFPEDA